jgi:hypothetical protein
MSMPGPSEDNFLLISFRSLLSPVSDIDISTMAVYKNQLAKVHISAVPSICLNWEMYLTSV